MTEELYTNEIHEVSVNVSQSEVESVRKKNIKKSGCRVYDGGCIGIAGTLGDASEETFQRAKDNLKCRVACSYEPEKNKKITRDYRNAVFTADSFVKEMRLLLEELREKLPDFIFSNTLAFQESEIRISNREGLDCRYADDAVLIELIVKHRDSANIMDSSVMTYGRNFDRETFVRDTVEYLTAFNRPAELPKAEKLPIITTDDVFLSKIREQLNGEAVGKGTSLFKDKFGQKVFSDRFTLAVDRSEDAIMEPFFDFQGVTLPDDKIALIENGVVKRPYADKRIAAEFGYEPTASAGGGYDDIPKPSEDAIAIRPGEKTLAELIGKKPAVLLVFAEGGDFTPSGDFATPVQMAYLIEDGKPVGRLPEFNLTGNMYQMFGEDYIGFSKDRALCGQRALVLNMKAGK